MTNPLQEAVREAISQAAAQAAFTATAWASGDTITPCDMEFAERDARAVGWRIENASVTNGQLAVNLTREDTMHLFTRVLLSSIANALNPADEWYVRERFEATFHLYADDVGSPEEGIAEAVKACADAGWIVAAVREDYNALVRFKAVKWDAGA